MALSLTVDIYPDKGLLMFTLAISCSKQNGKGKLLHRHVSFLAFGTAQQKHTEFFEFGTQPVSPSALHCCRRSQHSPVAVSHEKKHDLGRSTGLKGTSLYDSTNKTYIEKVTPLLVGHQNLNCSMILFLCHQKDIPTAFQGVIEGRSDADPNSFCSPSSLFSYSNETLAVRM
jgi:hypothetical protein